MKNLIVIPAYNEERTLGATLACLRELPDRFDVLIVDDGSTDETGPLAERLARQESRTIRVVRLRDNRGIGAAVQTGYLFARQSGCYRYVLQFDADGQHDTGAILDLVERCEREELDLCVGSRFIGATGGFRSTAMRRVGIRFLGGLVSALAGTRVTDPTSGLRCAGPRAWKTFASRYPDDYPEPESLFWCLRHGLRVGEAPVTMHERQGGVSSIGGLSSLYYMAKVTLAILVERLRAREAFVR